MLGFHAIVAEGMAQVPGTKPARSGTIARIHPDGSALTLFVFGDGGALEGVAEYGRQALSDLLRIDRAVITGVTTTAGAPITAEGLMIEQTLTVTDSSSRWCPQKNGGAENHNQQTGRQISA